MSFSQDMRDLGGGGGGGEVLYVFPAIYSVERVHANCIWFMVANCIWFMVVYADSAHVVWGWGGS